MTLRELYDYGREVQSEWLGRWPDEEPITYVDQEGEALIAARLGRAATDEEIEVVEGALVDEAFRRRRG